jgi:hypothetical protein
MLTSRPGRTKPREPDKFDQIYSISVTIEKLKNQPCRDNEQIVNNFLGAAIDTGAQRTVIRKFQALAYCH